jgi:acetyl esterase/lipase
MTFFSVHDWNDAYANAPNIVGGDAYPERWAQAAAAFRDRHADRMRRAVAYGAGPRENYDLFLPERKPRGLFVFVHGGYWMRFDASSWSHLAGAALANGYAAALPQYPLCPQALIADITRAIAGAISHVAGEIAGDIVLAGHSAGGHLAARMACRDAPLRETVAARIRHVVSISGVHDLRPLLATAMNETLRLDEKEAAAESPALLAPRANTRLTCWVGKGERAEFLRQNALLANVWRGLGAATRAIEEPDRHHFNVIDGLADPASPLARALFG